MFSQEFYFSLLILFTTIIIVSLLRAFNFSTILGYLIVGTIIGPNCLNLIKNVHYTHRLGQIGVLFLLFTIGLELPLERFKALWKNILKYGLPHVLLCSAILALLSYWFLSSQIFVATVLGTIFGLSSTAVALQELQERKETNSTIGSIALAILLVQDLVVIMLLIFLNNLSTADQSQILQLLTVIVKASGAILLLSFFSSKIMDPFYQAIIKWGHGDLLIISTLLLVLSMSTLTELSGLSAEFGAFLAGIMMANTSYYHQLEADIEPFKGLFLSLFFINVGMQIKFHDVLSNWQMASLVLPMVLLFKIFTVPLWGAFYRMNFADSLRLGGLIGAGSELAFILLQPLLKSQTINEDLANFVMIVNILSIFSGPILNLFINWSVKNFNLYQNSSEITADLDILIVGCNHFAEILAHDLIADQKKILLIDNNLNRVMELRKDNLPAILGNFMRHEIMKNLGAEEVKIVFIGLSKEALSIKVAEHLEEIFPRAKFIIKISNPKLETQINSPKIITLLFDNKQQVKIIKTLIYQNL